MPRTPTSEVGVSICSGEARFVVLLASVSRAPMVRRIRPENQVVEPLADASRTA